MLVLAMEFSRCARRAAAGARLPYGPAARREWARARGLSAGNGGQASHRRWRKWPGSERQGPRVAPSKRNSDARRRPQSPRASPTGHPKMCGRQGAGYRRQRIASDRQEYPTRMAGQRLLRKEVIQPHLPVRLPCYDFTPITDPTFDGSLLKGWATGFGCCRLSWCDGRCVQGPGTYSPRRC